MKMFLLYTSIFSIILPSSILGNPPDEFSAGVEKVEIEKKEDTRFNLFVRAKFPYVNLRIDSIEVVRCGIDSYQSKLGIKIKDKIVKVAGKDVEGMKLKKFREFILENVENESVPLVISRGESGDQITIIADFNQFIDKYEKFPKHFPRPSKNES